MDLIIKLESGKSVEFQGDRNKSVHKGGSLLGKGGQGAVYLVKECDTERTLALKVYNMPVSNVFVENLRKNIANGAPNDSFVWPLDLTEPMGKNSDRYGYTMELFDYSNYTSFARILKGKTTFPSKEKQIRTLINLAKAIDSLHSRGLCYQDLNDGSVMFDCQNGKVLICDNDNIAPCGINIPFDSEGHCVQGKLKYMAPEVASKILKPDEYSDRFSLAILIFMILLHAHPFDGVKRLAGPLTAEVQEKIYGTESVFIFHPMDDTNRPDSKIDINAVKFWPTLPQFIQDLFVRSFTNGIPAPGKEFEVLLLERKERPSAKEWCDALKVWLENINIEAPVCSKKEVRETIGEHNSEDTLRNYRKKQLTIEKLYINGEITFDIISPVKNFDNSYLVRDQEGNLLIVDVDALTVAVRNLNYSELEELQLKYVNNKASIIDVFAKSISDEGVCVFVQWECNNELRCQILSFDSNLLLTLDSVSDLF